MRWHSKRLIGFLTLTSLFGLPIFLADRVVAQAPPTGINKINHVIWIIQENRSFDNYFGTYPGADGIPSRDLSSQAAGQHGLCEAFPYAPRPAGARPCS